MPGSPRQLPFPRLAKKILDAYWSFHPTTAAAAGIHPYDGILPVYTAAALRAYTTRVREYLGPFGRPDRGDRLSRHVRLRTGDLRGLLAKYRPRLKTDVALGRRKYERMIFAEHLVDIPIERLLDVGRADLDANRRQFEETAKRIDPGNEPLQVIEGIAADHPPAERLIDDARAMLEEIREFVIAHDLVTVPSEERAQVMETPRFFRFATAALNPPESFEN